MSLAMGKFHNNTGGWILLSKHISGFFLKSGGFWACRWILAGGFWIKSTGRFKIHRQAQNAGGFLPVDSGLNPLADSKSTGKLKILLFLFPLPYYLVKSTYPILLCWNPTPHTSELLEKILPSALQNLPSACGLGQILEDLGQDFFQNSSDRGWISYHKRFLLTNV